MAEPLYTVPELARLLGVAEETVYRACRERRLGHHRIAPNVVRVPISAYKTYLERIKA